MKKIFLTLGLLFAPILILSGCCQKPETGILKDQIPTNGNGEENIFEGSLLDLIQKGTNLKCTFGGKDEQAKEEFLGVVYVADNKTRTETEIRLPDGTSLQTYSITDEEWMYTWSSQGPEGTKIRIDYLQEETNNAEAEEPETSEAPPNPLQEDFISQCLPWEADHSVFIPPVEINFRDITEEMKQVNEAIKEGDPEKLKEVLCNGCESLRDDTQKEQCKINLDCP